MALVGEPDSGKTFIAELAILLTGNDQSVNRSGSYNSISLPAFGQRNLKCTLPMIVSDPPKGSENGYAEIVQKVFDGSKHENTVLEYVVGASPILCVNGDFFKKWQNLEPEAW
jgi:hypothetical protein